MRLIHPTKLQEKKLREMIQKLFPQYQYVKFGKYGLISLSKSFWSYLFCKKDVVHITEFCTVNIPERLEELDSRITVDDGTFVPYRRVYNKYSHVVLDLLHNRATSIIDYLYDEYTYVKYGIHKTYYSINNQLPESTYTIFDIAYSEVKSNSIVLANFSNAYIKQALKRWKDAPFVLNHPILRRNFLDMWFKSEVKQYLRQIYDIKISIA